MKETRLARTAMERVLVLLRIRFASGARERIPLSALFVHAIVASFLCALARGILPPFAYGLFALSLTGGLVCVPLLGELGGCLRRDPANEWVRTLPLHARELELARVLHLLALLACLALASAIPAALLAPDTTALWARILLPALSVGWVVFLAALLLLIQSALGERADGALVLFQTGVNVLSVVGIVLGIRHLQWLARIPTLGDEEALFLWFVPPAWFAAPLGATEGEPALIWLPLVPTFAGLALLFVLPASAPPRRSLDSWLATLLAPARVLANRLWVRGAERGAFDLVYEALPREREVVLRAVPLLGIPLAFLVLASGESGDTARSGVLALLYFTAGAYLPVLLVHVPVSATPDASWILRTSPVPEGALAEGTIKALAVRFLVPLYAVLALLGATWCGPAAVLRLVLPGYLVSLLCMRWLHPRCVVAPPLSMHPEDVRFDLDRFGQLAALALSLTVIALLANRFLTSGTTAVGVSAALLGLELLLERNPLRKPG